MKILLTGATGLIGKAFGLRLVSEGHSVHVLSRDPERARTILPFPCEIFSWDGEREMPPRAAFEGVDAIIHLAGEGIAEKRWNAERKIKLRDSRIHAAARLSEGMRAAGLSPQVFITASAIGYYGDRGDEILTEESALGEGYLAELCRDWEAAAEGVPAKRTVKLRFGVVLSAMGGFLRQVVPVFQRLGASRLGSGQHYFSWIHVDDAVELLHFALFSKRLSGPVNAVAPESLTNAEMTAQLAYALKVFKAPPVPAVALKIRYGEMAQVLLASQRVVPQRLKAEGFHFKFPDFASALNAIYPDMQGGESLLKFQQWVPAQIEDVWPFFSSERNLERITPPFLNFNVIGKSTEEIGEGTLIDYRLSLRGFPMKWRTKISRWEPGKCFVDEQLEGPYKKWHHTHTFEPLAGGTLLTDIVRFQLPMGVLGRGVALGLVLSDVQGIFAYRTKVIDEVFCAH